MFNLSYFKYLIKSKKILIFFISLISVLLCLLGINTDIFEFYALPNLIISAYLAIAMPIIVFHFIQNKKAIDSYFSLPVSRRELLITGLIFSLIVSLIPYVITMIIASFEYLVGIKEFAEFNFTEVFLILLTLGLYIILVNSFVLLTYSFANSNIDGLIMIVAYSSLPLLIYVAASVFMETFVYGYTSDGLGYIMLLSPFHTGGNVILRTILDIRGEADFEFSYLISMLVQIVIYLSVLYKTFIKRKVERAETPSSYPFAYPFVIYAYAFILLFCISSNFTPDYSLWEFLKNTFILYIVIFICFTVAHFVYKRKFYIDIKMPAFFIVTLVVSLLFCTVARNTKGFGLAYNFSDFGEKTGYNLNTTINYNSDKYNEVYDYFHSLTNDDIYSIEITVINPNEESKEIMNRCRLEAIDNYYAEGDYASSSYMGIFQITNSYFENYKYKYRYYSQYTLSVEDIKILDNDSGCTIKFYGDLAYEYIYDNGEVTIPDYSAYIKETVGY